MDNITKNKETYDNFPYKSKSYEQTNPNRQKYILDVLGLSTKNLENARVLEIGCSYGGNIIPFAVGFENSEVIGIDLSEVQINKGKELIEKMNLKNINLYAMNILDYNYEFGKFDYIICHGVYSWVPKIVQEKILDVISKSLNENGVAHISYNVYPGWKSLDIYKKAMNFRKDLLCEKGMEFSENEIVNLGRGITEFIKNDTLLSENIKNKADDINNADSYYLYHEYFEMENNPKYLYDFNEELEKNNLFHVCDSNILKSLIPNNIKKILENECGNDYVAKEQYVDFLNNNQFRNSLITHLSNKEKLSNINNVLFSRFENTYIRLKCGIEAKDETTLIKELKNAYPNNVKFSNLFENPEIDNKELLESIIYNKFQIDAFKTNIVEKEKIKIKDRYVNYIKVLSKSDDMPIVLASKIGMCFSNNAFEMGFMLNFDGSKTVEDLVEILKEKHRNNEINVNISNETNLDEFLLEHVKKYKEVLEYNEMTE